MVVKSLSSVLTSWLSTMVGTVSPSGLSDSHPRPMLGQHTCKPQLMALRAIGDGKEVRRGSRASGTVLHRGMCKDGAPPRLHAHGLPAGKRVVRPDRLRGPTPQGPSSPTGQVAGCPVRSGLSGSPGRGSGG